MFVYSHNRDHAKGHLREWEQMQKQFLNEFRPKVGHNTTLRALTSLKHGREE